MWTKRGNTRRGTRMRDERCFGGDNDQGTPKVVHGSDKEDDERCGEHGRSASGPAVRHSNLGKGTVRCQEDCLNERGAVEIKYGNIRTDFRCLMAWNPGD